MQNEEFLPVPNNMQGALEYAKVLAGSRLIPKVFQGKPSDVLVAMMWSKTLGVPVLQGLQGIAVINDRPTLWGDLMMAVCQKSGLLTDIAEGFTGKDSASLTATCTVKRKDRPTPITRSFSWADAIQAGLSERNTWKAYPKRMLQMRARSQALRDAFPDVLMGLGSADEAIDMTPQQTSTGAAVEMGSVETAENLMPVRKSAQQPTPEIEHDQHEEKAVLESTVQQPEQVPVQQAVEVPTKAQAVEESYSVQQIESFRADIYDAKTVKELDAVWKKMPKAIRNQLRNDFSQIGTELRAKEAAEPPKSKEQEENLFNAQQAPQPAF